MRNRAEFLAHVHNTNSPYHLAEVGKQRAYEGNRDGVAERLPEPAVQQSLAVARTRIDTYDRRLTALALDLVGTAKAHETQTFDRWRSIPGGGKRLARVLLDEIHDTRRFPRVPAFVSDCRRVQCAQESAGTRSGTSGKTSGKAYLQGACSDAVLSRRHTPPGQKSLPRFARNHGQGNALTLPAHPWARGGMTC
jgi:Transposase IS116/IS110/IS902 family